jgi:tetratricopeptide (TPR) repeat protein
MSSREQSYSHVQEEEFGGTNEEKDKNKKHYIKENNLRLLEEGVHAAKTLIIRGNPEQASASMFDLLKKVKDDFDEAAVELLPSYFVLAEANIMWKEPKLKKAEQLLIAAYWNLLKYTSDDNKASGVDANSSKEVSRYRASLHKTFGRLFIADNEPEKALKELSQAIYLECMEYGPESIQLCSSYYYLANIFYKDNRKEETKSFYQKIIEIWKKHILEQEFTEEEQMREYQINEELYFEEAKEHLKNILGFFEVEYGPEHTLTAEWEVAFALVMLRTGNDVIAGEFLEKAYYILTQTLGEFDPKTKEVGELAKKVQEMQRQNNEQYEEDEEDQ